MTGFAAETGTKRVLVFRNELLRNSETFIKAQAGALRSYAPSFVGLERIGDGLELSCPVLVLSETAAKWRKLFYQQFGFAPAFHRKAAQIGAGLIHAHFAMDGVFALPLANSLRLPLVVTLHGFDITRKPEFSRNTQGDRIVMKRRGKLARRTSVFICVSEFIRRAALASGLPEEKLKVHYIGIDRTYFTPGTDPRNAGLILFVGRLVEKKGGACLLRAMADVLRHCPGAHVVMIGDGPERPALEKWAALNSVPCQFLGSQSPAVILDWLRKARVFCVPSLTAQNGDSEGLGMVFAEAQATGLPVVSFAHGGVPEVVKHGHTGLLAPEGDEKKLAEHLIRMINSDDEWRAFSRNGMDWIGTRFDLLKQTRLLEEIYSGVLAAPDAVSTK